MPVTLSAAVTLCDMLHVQGPVRLENLCLKSHLPLMIRLVIFITEIMLPAFKRCSVMTEAGRCYLEIVPDVL
jgi:hypothetical protein